jgi:glycosyltransferase involved in cell wall biosynthesis
MPQIDDDYLKNCLENVEIVYPSNRKTNSLLQDMLLARRFAVDTSIKKEFDVLLNFNDLIGAYFIQKRLGLPMVFDICDDVPHYVANSPQVPRLLRPLSQKLAKSMLKKNTKASSRITYTTESLKKAYALEAKKSTLIPNGVDLELFTSPQQLQNKKLLAEDGCTIGFVGFLASWIDFAGPLKSLRNLIEKGYNIKFIIVGDGPELTRIREMTIQLGVLDNVVFVGSVPYVDVPVCISRMDICLLPFKKDPTAENALPLKLFEYMACEKPVISTELEGVKDAVGSRVFYASDVASFESHIETLYADEKLRARLGREGRCFVEQNYSWPTIAKRFESLVYAAAK